MSNVEQIAEVLFLLDPMNTSCLENNLRDEYKTEAEMIANGTSVRETFEFQFYQNCLDENMIRNIESQIK